jgi:hypothetical protein
MVRVVTTRTHHAGVPPYYHPPRFRAFAVTVDVVIPKRRGNQ